MAATLCAAELQVSREIQLPEIELRIFNLAIPAYELVTGWRKGRRLGLLKFLASAGKSNGAICAELGKREPARFPAELGA